MDKSLIQRFLRGGQQTSVRCCWVSAAHPASAARIDPKHLDKAVLKVNLTETELQSAISWHNVPFIVASPDLSGAVLITVDGYALLAGTDSFVDACVPEGSEETRVQLARYARRIVAKWPKLEDIRQLFPARFHSWSSPSEVESGTATAEQIFLLESLINGEVTAGEFQSQWLTARRRAMSAGERTREEFTHIFDKVFFALEDYVADVKLRESGDLSDQELIQRIDSLFSELKELDRRRET